MRTGSTLRGAVTALLLLVTADAAAAFPAGTTTLITRPAGDLPLVGSGTGRSGLASAAGDGSVVGGRQISDDGRHVVFASEADELSSLDVDTTPNVYVRDTVANTTELVSRATGAAGVGGVAPSGNPAISGDGTTVAFSTTAGLDPADTNSGTLDVYVRDLVTDVTTRLPASGQNDHPSLDEDGSHLAFTTSAALDAANDTNGELDVYVWEVGTSNFELASRLTGTGAALAGTSWRPAISDDGTRVAFETDAPDFADDDDTKTDIAVRILSTASSFANTTLLASRATGTGIGAQGTAGNGDSTQPALSGDGSSVAFVSAASNLVAGDANGDPDVFRRTISTFTTTRTSVTDAEGEIDQASGSALPSISDDGALVTFTAFPTGIAPDDGASLTEKVYVRAPAAGTTQVVSRPSGASATGLKAGSNAISGDGHSVAFTGTDDGYSAEDDDTDTRQPHIYVRRLGTYPIALEQHTTLFADRPTGTAPFTGTSSVDKARLAPGAISWDGRHVAFSSDADDLVPGQTPADNAFSNAYVRDTVAGTLEWVNEGHPGPISQVAISADGRTAVFTSAGNAYVRDLDAQVTTLVSRADGPSGAAASSVAPNAVAISGDGGRVAFVTGSALDGADGNATEDVYVRDLATDDTILASRADDEGSADADASRPALDWDGSTVAFESTAANLVGTVDANGAADVFVRDLAAGTTVLASRAGPGAGPIGDDASSAPSLDGDGRRVAFATEADNLGGTGTNPDVAVRDLLAGTTTAVASTGSESQPALSDDGTKLVLVSDASLVAADTRVGADVYLRDLTADTTSYVSRADGASGAAANLPAGGNALAYEGPAVSGSGECVAFTTQANNLDPDWAGTGVELGYLRTVGSGCPDTTTPETTLDGGPGGETTDADPEFTFSASERHPTFDCAIDGEPFGACTSPVTTAPLAPGPHVFRVRARDVVGNLDATPAEREFTVIQPASPPPADDPGASSPAASSPAASPPGSTRVARDPAKLKVLRAGVSGGVLDLLVEITSNAAVPGADLDVAYESSGRTTRFSVPISAGVAAGGPRARTAERRVSIRRTLPKSQPKSTGIVELSYAGNDRVTPDKVRLRAASGRADLVRGTTSLSGGRLKVQGTISSRARGVVRLRLGFDGADGSTGFAEFTAPIRAGVWKLDRALTGDAAKGGYLSIQFTGYEAAGMRGEQTGKAVP